MGTRGDRSCQRIWEWAGIWTVAAILIVWPGQAWGWGSVLIGGQHTHRLIDRQAHALLAQDPALAGGDFPGPAQLQEHDSVYADGQGPGPDNYALTKADDHYYNPALGLGQAHQRVSEHYRVLAAGLALGGAAPQALAKAAAWASHFLADLHSPFHVSGTSPDHLRRLLEEANRAGADSPLRLPATVQGVPALCHRCPPADRVDDVRSMAQAFLEELKDKPHLNWFDPWLLNGSWPLGLEISSHFTWESDAYNATPPGQPGAGPDLDQIRGLLEDEAVAEPTPAPTPLAYHQGWRNPAPSFDESFVGQAQAARALAMAVAEATRRDQAAGVKSPGQGQARAIEATATLWRASFSALAPELTTRPTQEGLEVTAKIANRAGEPATGVKARLEVKGGQLKGPELVEVGSIGAKGIGEAKWVVNFPDPKALKTLTVRVIGGLAGPDLQFSKKTLTLKEATRVYEGFGQLSGYLTLAGEPPQPGACKNRKADCHEQKAPLKVVLEADGRVNLHLVSAECWRVDRGNGLGCLRCPSPRKHDLTGRHDNQSVWTVEIPSGRMGGTFTEDSLKGEADFKRNKESPCGKVTWRTVVTFDLPRQKDLGPAPAGESGPDRPVDALRQILKGAKSQ